MLMRKFFEIMTAHGLTKKVCLLRIYVHYYVVMSYVSYLTISSVVEK